MSKHSTSIRKRTDLLINIGCGQVAANGWLNLDKSLNAWLAKHSGVRWLLRRLRLLPRSTYETSYPSDIKVLDIHKRGLPVSDGSAHWIYSSMVISHMTRKQALSLMKECFRALRPGGGLRLVTLDLAEVATDWREKIDAYLANDRSFYKKWDDPDIDIGDCFVRSLDLKLYTRMNLSRIQRFFDYPLQHYYDYTSLALLLHQAGFTRITRGAYRDSTMPDVEILDIHPESMVVEAFK